MKAEPFDFCTERHPRCPLIHVPDHGRLIDADVLFDFILNIYKNANGDARKAYSDVLDVIVATGDVIPADKEGEELAIFLCDNVDCAFCESIKGDCTAGCKDRMLLWLKAPVEVQDG